MFSKNVSHKGDQDICFMKQVVKLSNNINLTKILTFLSTISGKVGSLRSLYGQTICPPNEKAKNLASPHKIFL